MGCVTYIYLFLVFSVGTKGNMLLSLYKEDSLQAKYIKIVEYPEKVEILFFAQSYCCLYAQLSDDAA